MTTKKETSNNNLKATSQPPDDGRSVFVCTCCGGDATVSWSNNTKEDKNYFGGIIHPGERLCLSCGKKRGVGFF